MILKVHSMWLSSCLQFCNWQLHQAPHTPMVRGCQSRSPTCTCRVQKLDPKQLPAGVDAAAVAAAGFVDDAAAASAAAEPAVSFGEPAGKTACGKTAPLTEFPLSLACKQFSCDAVMPCGRSIEQGLRCCVTSEIGCLCFQHCLSVTRC